MTPPMASALGRVGRDPPLGEPPSQLVCIERTEKGVTDPRFVDNQRRAKLDRQSSDAITKDASGKWRQTVRADLLRLVPLLLATLLADPPDGRSLWSPLPWRPLPLTDADETPSLSPPR